MHSPVYVNYGNVIVDCPFRCGNSYPVNPRSRKLAKYIMKGRKKTAIDLQTPSCYAETDGCHVPFELVFHEDFIDILNELERRPRAMNRNWYPAGHPTAIARGWATEQTVAELATEFALAVENGE